MTVAADLAAAQAQFKADFDQFKIDLSAELAALRTAVNSDDEAAMETAIGNLQTMDADLKNLDASLAVPVATPTPGPAPAPAPAALAAPATPAPTPASADPSAPSS